MVKLMVHLVQIAIITSAALFSILANMLNKLF